MKRSPVKILIILFHILFWTVPVLVLDLSLDNYVLVVFESKDFNFFYPLYYGTAINALFFYSSVFWLMPKLVRIYNVFYSIAGTILFYFLVSFLEAGIDQIVVHIKYGSADVSFLTIFIGNLVINILFFCLAMGYFVLSEWVKSEKYKMELKQEKLQMELDFLKSQVNPHFIFNTLNNLFASARKNHDEQTAKGIAKLSGLMRYMLYEANVESIMLEKEIEYLQNYIILQKMRFNQDDDIDIEMKINGCPQGLKIAPMILIPFVENAFKYGISLKEHSYIAITFQIYSDKLIFTVENSINKPKLRQVNSGVGLKNAKRRLELLYNKKHDLEFSETAGKFKVKLQLFY